MAGIIKKNTDFYSDQRQEITILDLLLDEDRGDCAFSWWLLYTGRGSSGLRTFRTCRKWGPKRSPKIPKLCSTVFLQTLNLPVRAVSTTAFNIHAQVVPFPQINLRALCFTQYWDPVPNMKQNCLAAKNRLTRPFLSGRFRILGFTSCPAACNLLNPRDCSIHHWSSPHWALSLESLQSILNLT